MKRSITLLVAVLITCMGMAYAAIRGPVLEKRGNPVLEALNEMVLDGMGPGQPGPILGLTEEQRGEIRSAVRHYRDEFRNVVMFTGADVSWQEIDTELADVRVNLHEEVEAVLDEEQREKLEEIRSDLEHGESPRIVVDGLVELAGTLFDLTPLQRATTTEILLDAGDELLYARETCPSMREWFVKAREIVSTTGARFAEILDGEQGEEFLEWKESLREKVKNKLDDYARDNLDIRVKRMSFALDLSEVQQAELRAILAGAHQEILAGIETFPEPDGGLIIDQIVSVDRNIQGILDDTQLTRYERMKSLMRRQLVH